MGEEVTEDVPEPLHEDVPRSGEHEEGVFTGDEHEEDIPMVFLGVEGVPRCNLKLGISSRSLLLLHWW